MHFVQIVILISLCNLNENFSAICWNLQALHEGKMLLGEKIESVYVSILNIAINFVKSPVEYFVIGVWCSFISLWSYETIGRILLASLIENVIWLHFISTMSTNIFSTNIQPKLQMLNCSTCSHLFSVKQTCNQQIWNWNHSVCSLEPFSPGKLLTNFPACRPIFTFSTVLVREIIDWWGERRKKMFRS